MKKKELTFLQLQRKKAIEEHGLEMKNKLKKYKYLNAKNQRW